MLLDWEKLLRHRMEIEVAKIEAAPSPESKRWGPRLPRFRFLRATFGVAEADCWGVAWLVGSQMWVGGVSCSTLELQLGEVDLRFDVEAADLVECSIREQLLEVSSDYPNPLVGSSLAERL